MTTRRIAAFIFALALLGATLAAAQQSTGRIEGRVTRASGGGVGGVTVLIAETRASTTTDRNGNFSIGGVPPGSYTLSFILGDNRAAETGVSVTAGQTTRLDKAVDWEVSFAETITVYSASRRAERIVEAPAAVTIVAEEQIEREAAHGQLPKLLEFTPGAEVTQSGIYDYNFNTRGFNSSLNRRVATLIDGRNPSVPFLGAQEWAALSFPLDDLASVELVRGPSAALYGANASSGVLNMTSKEPRLSQGGMVRLTGGELSTTNADFRYAGNLGGGWYFKIAAGARDHDDFTVSRRGAAEYTVPCGSGSPPATTNCLPQEAVPLKLDSDEIVFGSFRVDKYLGNKRFTIEGGQANIEGPAFQTGIGRVQLIDVERPWARFNFSTDHFNVLVNRSDRTAPEQLALASGANLALDTSRTGVEVQTNWTVAGDKVRIVGGASFVEEDIDSEDPRTGRQTLMFAPVEADTQAVFGQVDIKVGDRVKLVLASRWDDSDLHDSQFSPKGSIVYSINQDHTLRFTYNEAFQVANYSEFFLQAPAAPNADLSQLEGLCRASGVFDCGLTGPTLGGPGTPILALGNKDLELEEVRTFEIGYSGIIANKAYVTIDAYMSENENFITDLLPQLGTALGRVNPNFGPWVGSTAAETSPTICPGIGVTTVANCVRALAPPILSNNLDGSAILAAVSYTNFGDVDTEGVDLGLTYYFADKWTWAFSYSWFDFELKDALPGFQNLLVPNTPENKATSGLTYSDEQLSGTVSVRWVDDFLWAVGPFQGLVESYTTVDLNGNWRFNDNWSVGINVANLFDDEHWEAFGGDLLARRALAHVQYNWR